MAANGEQNVADVSGAKVDASVSDPDAEKKKRRRTFVSQFGGLNLPYCTEEVVEGKADESRTQYLDEAEEMCQ